MAKLELAFRAVKDDIMRSEDGRLMSKAGSQVFTGLLAGFVQENPELLPARIQVAVGPASCAGRAAGYLWRH